MRASQQLRTPLVLSVLLLVILLGLMPLTRQAAWAAPVSWQEVTSAPEGRQWWDSGSLRLDRAGRLSVLSRFQPAPPAADRDISANAAERRSALYVMQLDCDGQRWRDVAVNGLPRPRAPWQQAGQDELTDRVLQAACQAAASLGISPTAGSPA